MAGNMVLTNLRGHLRSAVLEISGSINKSSLNPRFMGAMRAEPFDPQAAASVAGKMSAGSVYACLRNETVSVLDVVDTVELMNLEQKLQLFDAVFDNPPADASRTARILELSPKVVPTIPTISNRVASPGPEKSFFAMIMANPNLSVGKKNDFNKFLPAEMATHIREYSRNHPFPRLFGIPFSVDAYHLVANIINNGYITEEMLGEGQVASRSIWEGLSSRGIIKLRVSGNPEIGVLTEESKAVKISGGSDSINYRIANAISSRHVITPAMAAQALIQTNNSYLVRGLLSFHTYRIFIPAETSAAILDSMPESEAVKVLVGMRNRTLRTLFSIAGIHEDETDRLLAFGRERS